MEGMLQDGTVRVEGDARQRFYDSRGYGRPLDGNAIELAPVEAAHLLFRNDLDGVRTDGRSLGFREFLSATAGRDSDGFALRFLVYADLRQRGFYLSPAREEWTDDPRRDVDFVVYERGTGPDEHSIAYRVRVIGERSPITASALGDVVLGVVDEESEITYLDTDHPTIAGSSGIDLPSGVAGQLLADRVLLWAAPDQLYDHGFYGRPLGGRDGDGDGPLQLSLVEAAYLAARGAIELDESIEGGGSVSEPPEIPDGRSDAPDYLAIVGRGRSVEGERFDRRLRTYAALRNRNVVPKTGFKFGADFRTYADVESVDDLGHSELLVRTIPFEHAFSPRDLALDVRLSGGVRKRMVFARIDDDRIDWLVVERVTP